MTTDDRGDSAPAEAGHGGSSVRTYVLIAVVLAVLTYVEWQLPIVLSDQYPLMVTSLIVTALVKAGLVMAFYMHMKFDSRVYTGVVALALALVAYFLVFLLWEPLPLP